MRQRGDGSAKCDSPHGSAGRIVTKQLLSELFRREDALDKAKVWAKLDPTNCDPHHYRGTILNAQNKFSEALQEFDQAENLCAIVCPHLLSNQAIVYANLHDYALALEKAGEALSRSDLSLRLRIGTLTTKARCELALEEAEKANETLDECVALIEDYPPFKDWYNLGCLLWRFKRYEGAVGAYQRGLEVNTDHGEAWTNLALALEKLGRLEEAQNAYQKALNVTDVPYQAPLNYMRLLSENPGLLANMWG